MPTPGSSFLPPWLTLVMSFAFSAWLIRKDLAEGPVGGKSMWLAGIWLFFINSRSFGRWMFDVFGLSSGDSSLEGNLLDVVFLCLMIILSIRTLNERRLDWGRVVSRNLPIVALYLFFLLSAVWSDFPLVVIKRVIKDSSLCLLVLLLMTEPKMEITIRKIFLRLSYLLFPLSVVLIKWFPSIGRTSSAGGESMMGGVAVHKNTLGEILVVFGVILVWDLRHLLYEDKLPWRDPKILRRLLMLAIGLWLLITANSQTAVLCLALALGLLVVLDRINRSSHPKVVFTVLVLFAAILGTVDSVFHIKENIVASVGRDMTFTGRTRIWEIVKAQPNDPVLGGGFMMFWDSSIGARAREEIGVALNTAHNGFLEVFLDGGVVGLVLLGFMLLTKGLGILSRFFSRGPLSNIALIFLIVAILYNLSESNFFRLGPIWLMTLFAMIDPLAIRSGVQSKET